VVSAPALCTRLASPKKSCRQPRRPPWVLRGRRSDDTGLGEDLGPASDGASFHVLCYRLCDLLAALRRSFYRVGVILFFGADQPQIQQGKTAGERRADDAIVEHRKPCDRHLLQGRFGETRVVDGADRRV